MKQTGLDAAALASGESVFAFGTKAETLLRLKPRLVGAQIPESCHFSAGQWLAQRDELLDAIQQQFESALRDLTRSSLKAGPDSTLERALLSTAEVHKAVISDPVDDGGNAWLARAAFLIRQCREHGALSFAVVARHAFIAENLLRSARRRGVLTEERVAELRRSIRTVTGEMVMAYAQACRSEVSRADFLREYGHLRPGTYEITSLRYDERDDLFDTEQDLLFHARALDFVLTDIERDGLDALLAEAGLDVLGAEQLLDYVRKAIAGREHVKFLFTRMLSDALSALGRWGALHGLSRDDLSHLPWPRLADCLVEPGMDYVDRHFLVLAEEGRRTLAAAHAFRFSHIIFGVEDLYIATHSRSAPNFVGSGKASGPIMELNADTSANLLIRNRIVCIESAYPGFDWIFTKSPSALITKFGGANSHMAIRCAKLGLPAAIGCGQQVYERILAAGQVEQDCAQRILKCLGGE